MLQAFLGTQVYLATQDSLGFLVTQDSLEFLVTLEFQVIVVLEFQVTVVDQDILVTRELRPVQSRLLRDH